MDQRSFLRELLKLGAVSTDEAQRALNQLQQLEQNKPNAGTVARYAGTGALAGAGVTAVGNLIEHGPRKLTPKGVAASAVKGALSAGAVPLLQAHLDRRAQMGTLRQFVQQPGDVT